MKKTAIVSGAGGALGSIVVQRLLDEGYAVHALYRSHVEKNDHPSLFTHIVDLLNEEETAELVEKIRQESSVIDLLVCCAGGFRAGDVEKTDAAAMQRQYELNFLTAYHLARPAFLQMKKQGFGHIFFIGSRQGSDATQSVHTVAYGLSKTLLFNLAKIFNEDAGGKVTTSVIVPSTIDTQANRDSMPEADFTKWVTPEEIADIILFYDSEKAKSIKSPVIRIFGGS